jgi:hypothetical protein
LTYVNLNFNASKTDELSLFDIKSQIQISLFHQKLASKSNNKIDFAFCEENKVTKIHLSSHRKEIALTLFKATNSYRSENCLPLAHKSNIKLNTNKFTSLHLKLWRQKEKEKVSDVTLHFSQNKDAHLMFDQRL